MVNQRFRGRLWFRLLLATLLPTGLTVIAIGWLSHRAAANALEQQLGESLMSTARVAAGMMAKPRALSLIKGDEDSRTYSTLKKKLSDLKIAAGAEHIYLFDLQGRTLVDSEGSWAIGEPIVQLATNRSELSEVYAGQSRSSVLFSSADGTRFKTGFAPVRLEGKVVAVIGVDGSASFFEPLASLNRTLALAALVVLLLAILASLLVSRRITSPLNRLAQAARDIGAGELEAEIKIETGDEIGMLAHTLNDMRRSILARDRQLQMMLSGIAHEVRNPLGGMTLFVGLLEEELTDNPAALKHVERIGGELDYLSRVVSDFLDFARKKPALLSPVDPGQELEQIHSLCLAQLEQAQVELKIDIAQGIESAMWDQERIRGALLNLVRNSIQASPAGSVVSLGLTRTEGGLRLTVCDQGSGIAEDKQHQIFEPFFTTRQKGTGLGLALTRKTVESHGGQISFISEAGKGTTFTIELPEPDQKPLEDA